MELHETLRAVVDSSGLSQAQIARSLEIAQSTLSGWLTGSTPASELNLTRLVMLRPDLSRDAATALLADLLRLRLRARITREDAVMWTEQQRALAQDAMRLLRTDARVAGARPTISGDRTLRDFPDAFYPLVVVSGDKRERSESRINLADFGAVSASPAESRWIAKLRLNEHVEFLTDKIFVLETASELRKRFANRNLLVIGSPGSNHLARRMHLETPLSGWRQASPIFRFNPPQETVAAIEELLDRLRGRSAKELSIAQADDTERDMKVWLKYLFTGGIVDPSYEFLLRGHALVPNVDFGLLSLARHPLSDDDTSVAIMAAGFHLLGTAHAIRMLSEPENFENHPFGGVLRVDVPLEAGFGRRFDSSSAAWDTESVSSSKPELIQGLRRLAQKVPRMINLQSSVFEEALAFVDKL